MIRFDLLCDLKEVELTEHHTQSSNIINRTFRRQVSHSNTLSLAPTVVLDLLGHSHSHGMGKGVTNNLKPLSHACLPMTRDQNFHFCASASRFKPLFQAEGPGHYP